MLDHISFNLDSFTSSSVADLVLYIILSLCCIAVNVKVVKDLNEDDRKSRQYGNGIVMINIDNDNKMT